MAYGRRVPELGNDSVRAWMTLQEERCVWASEHWNGFVDNFAPEKDWWRKERESGNEDDGKGEEMEVEEQEQEGNEKEEERRQMTPIPVFGDTFDFL